jgi:hypothetical protein
MSGDGLASGARQGRAQPPWWPVLRSTPGREGRWRGGQPSGSRARRAQLRAEARSRPIRPLPRTLAIDRSHLATFTVERIGAPSVVDKRSRAHDLDELQIAVDESPATAAGVVNDVQVAPQAEVVAAITTARFPDRLWPRPPPFISPSSGLSSTTMQGTSIAD